MEYLYMIQQALVWLLTAFWGYQLIISICSLVKLKDKPILEIKLERLACKSERGTSLRKRSAGRLPFGTNEENSLPTIDIL